MLNILTKHAIKRQPGDNPSHAQAGHAGQDRRQRVGSGGIYFNYAERYAQILKRDEDSEFQVGFIQSGTGNG